MLRRFACPRASVLVAITPRSTSSAAILNAKGVMNGPLPVMASTLIPDTGVAEEPLDPGDDAWKGQPVALAVVAAMEAATKAVVAICVVLVPTLAVGATLRARKSNGQGRLAGDSQYRLWRRGDTAEPVEAH